MIQNKLVEKFGNHINHMSCVYLNDGEKWLRHFLDKCGTLKTVIEIGTYQGVSAGIISEYAKKVFTVDIKKQKLTKKVLDFLKADNVECLIVKTRKKEKETVKKILSDNLVDLAFIDGHHEDGEIVKDFDMVKNCDKILVHDYNEGFPEVFDFCNNLKELGWKLERGGSYCLLTK